MDPEQNGHCSKVSVENIEESGIPAAVVLEKTMELLELEDECVPEVSARTHAAPTNNRRYRLRPQRRLNSTRCDGYAVKPSPKRLSAAKQGFLETIFETPIARNGSLVYLGKAKLKRSITFNDFVAKAKIKHRKSKVKRLCKKNYFKKSKITVEDVKRRLQCLEDLENNDEWIDVNE